MLSSIMGSTEPSDAWTKIASTQVASRLGGLRMTFLLSSCDMLSEEQLYAVKSDSFTPSIISFIWIVRSATFTQKQF